LTIPRGTQTGDRLTLHGCGVPALRGEGRGNQIVHIVVKTPTQLTERQEELLREFAALDGEHTKTKKRWPWSKGN
ncbi:MAG: molecular chaperone DnaJ, partial [candidate division KSB1 bacterium]|nr:molecular chaperone DnaJ [candidate division KSB1 bacterium]